MLNNNEIDELKEHLERAQNPLFYFDNDQDGLCGYLLLRRFYKKGYGVPVKTSPLGKEYFGKTDEINPDYIFILDQPRVSDEFFSLSKEKNIPVVWVDHHESDKEKIPREVYYYNPLFSDGNSEPVTKICYEVTRNKSDLWILIAGCLADKFFPKEYENFMKDYPELCIKSTEPFEIFYFSEIGKISRMMGAGLKDRTSLVKKMIKFLVNVKTPYEVLEENSENLSFHRRFEVIDKKMNVLYQKAKKKSSPGKLLFFRYSGEISMSADLSNKLNFAFPKKLIVVAFLKGARVNVSIRGKDARDIVEKALENIPLATYGGHKDAVGAQMNEDQLDLFEENLGKILEDKKD